MGFIKDIFLLFYTIVKTIFKIIIFICKKVFQLIAFLHEYIQKSRKQDRRLKEMYKIAGNARQKDEIL